MNPVLVPNVLRRCVVAASVLSCLAACPSGLVTASGAPPSPESDGPSAVPTLFGALPTNPIDAATATALQSVLDDAVEAGNPDVIAAVITADGTWAGAAGIDGPDGRRAVPTDVFSIASITKTFTAALILRLVDQGRIDLDEPLSDYLGGLHVDTNGSTVRQALAMRSGIPDTAPESLDAVVADPERIWTTPEIVAEIPPPVSPPGAELNYSNPTYKLLGYAAESVTGSALYEAMRSEVLDPADSPDTILVQNADTPTPEPWALPITSGVLDVASYGAGGALPTISDATFAGAGTAMASDAPSLAALAWQLFAGNIVSAESLSAMTDVADDGYGLGVEDLTGGFGTATAVGHGGSKDGYQSLMAVIPDQQAVIVVFVNQRDADVTLIASRVLDALGA